MTPTDLQLVQGDATTIPEETAFAAYQTLREARTNPKLAANPALATSREALKSYVTERRRHGHDLFPSVTTAANRERNDSLAGLYTKPLEKALPQQAFADLTRKMEFVPDPETFKMREINRTFRRPSHPAGKIRHHPHHLRQATPRPGQGHLRSRGLHRHQNPLRRGTFLHRENPRNRQGRI